MKNCLSWGLCSLEIALLLVVGICVVSWRQREDDSTLEVLQVICRHGARTPFGETYPNDANVQFLSLGKGQLTREGAMQMYEMGKILQKTYRHFLINDYRTVLVQSSPSTRCIQSGQATLAGMFPNQWDAGNDVPVESQMIPPVAVHVPPPPRHKTLYISPEIVIESVGNVEHFLERHLSKEIVQAIKRNSSAIPGFENVSILQLLSYYDALRTEKFHSLILPPWFNSTYPNLELLANTIFVKISANSTIAKKFAGELLEEILLNFETPRNTKDTKTKINTFLYFTHDFNLVCLLGLLKVPLSAAPLFGATLSIEKPRILYV